MVQTLAEETNFHLNQKWKQFSHLPLPIALAGTLKGKGVLCDSGLRYMYQYLPISTQRLQLLWLNDRKIATISWPQ